jgi:DNA-binding response OmpR family regulator
VARHLSDLGYEVVTLHDPLTALEFVAEGGCDLVITNSVMSGINGAQLVARLRRQFPTLPVLHLDDQAHPRASEFPADVPTLNKSFAHDALRDCVRQLLKR